MSDFVLDKNVPLPTNRKPHGFYKSRFDNMEVGDSFVLPIEENVMNQRAIIKVSATQAGVKKITIRKVFEDGIWVLRTWRLE